jgi:putative endonuclease
MAKKDEVGRRGEQIAADLVTAQGYRVVARNWRGRSGELDLVALEGATLAVIEVKTRSSARFGLPAEAVTPKKIARLRALTGQWLAENAAALPVRLREVRLDVIAVLLAADGTWQADHLRAVS